MAQPSALTGYDSNYLDLLHADGSGHYQYLRDNQGLVAVNDFYTDTTGTETMPGHAQGYLADTKLQWGQACQNGALHRPSTGPPPGPHECPHRQGCSTAV